MKFACYSHHAAKILRHIKYSYTVKTLVCIALNSWHTNTRSVIDIYKSPFSHYRVSAILAPTFTQGSIDSDNSELRYRRDLTA